MTVSTSIIHLISDVCKKHSNVVIITTKPDMIRDEIKRNENIEVDYLPESCINPPVRLENVWRFFLRGDSPRMLVD